MAYQAKRKRLYAEDFELVEEDGTVVHTLHIELDPDSMAKKLSVKQIDLHRALEDIKKVKPEEDAQAALETLGNAVTDLLEAVFGKEDAQAVTEFYNGRYMEMCREVVPFITAEVIPSVRRIAQDNRKAIAAGYNRATRRLLFGNKGR